MWIEDSDGCLINCYFFCEIYIEWSPKKDPRFSLIGMQKEGSKCIIVESNHRDRIERIFHLISEKLNAINID